MLFAVEKFFVEVKYSLESNIIVDKTSFISGKKLNRYSNLPDSL